MSVHGNPQQFPPVGIVFVANPNDKAINPQINGLNFTEPALATRRAHA